MSVGQARPIRALCRVTKFDFLFSKTIQRRPKYSFFKNGNQTDFITWSSLGRATQSNHISHVRISHGSGYFLWSHTFECCRVQWPISMPACFSGYDNLVRQESSHIEMCLQIGARKRHEIATINIIVSENLGCCPKILFLQTASDISYFP